MVYLDEPSIIAPQTFYGILHKIIDFLDVSCANSNFLFDTIEAFNVKQIIMSPTQNTQTTSTLL